MKEITGNKKRFCGNCTSHNTYNYPDLVFCTKRFKENENPIVQTLWCCEKWKESTQWCACVATVFEKKK